MNYTVFSKSGATIRTLPELQLSYLIERRPIKAKLDDLTRKLGFWMNGKFAKVDFYAPLKPPLPLRITHAHWMFDQQSLRLLYVYVCVCVCGNEHQLAGIFYCRKSRFGAAQKLMAELERGELWERGRRGLKTQIVNARLNRIKSRGPGVLKLNPIPNLCVSLFPDPPLLSKSNRNGQPFWLRNDILLSTFGAFVRPLHWPYVQNMEPPKSHN